MTVEQDIAEIRAEMAVFRQPPEVTQALEAVLQHVRNHDEVVVGTAAPTHVADEPTLFWDKTNDLFYINSGGSTWIKIGGAGISAHAMLDGSTHSDSVAQGVTRGSLVVANSTPKYDELVVGASARILQSDGTDPSYVAMSGDATIAAGGEVTVAGTHAGTAHHAQSHTLASHSAKAHADLSDAPASAHHTKYTDANAVTAIEAEDPLDLAGVLNLAKNVNMTKGTSANIDSNDEIAVPTVSWLYLTSAGASDNLDGIGAGTEGQIVFLTVVAGKDITLIHNGTVTAGKKLLINGEANVTLNQDHDFVIAIYDATATVWNVMVPGTGGGGAVGTDVIWDAKGDLAGGTGADTAVRLAVGSNDQVLTAASGETTGMKWAAAGGHAESHTLISHSTNPQISDVFSFVTATDVLTLVDGVIQLPAAPFGIIRVTSQTGATDDLDDIEINGGGTTLVPGTMIALTNTDGDAITLKHLNGKMLLSLNADVVLNDDSGRDLIILQAITTGIWSEMWRSPSLMPVASLTVQGKVELTTPAETKTGTSSTQAVTPASLGTADRTIALTAGGGWPTTTAGCAQPTRVETPTNKIDYWVMDFNTAVDENAFWLNPMPDNYDGGTVTFQPYWTAASGSGTVVWLLAARAFADSDAIDQPYSDPGESSTDTLITANDVHIGPESSAITINGGAAGGELVQWRLTRDVSADSLGVDARLLGLKITYQTNAFSD